MEGASILNQYSPAKRELVQVGIFPQSHCEQTKAIALAVSMRCCRFTSKVQAIIPIAQTINNNLENTDT